METVAGTPAVPEPQSESSAETERLRTENNNLKNSLRMTTARDEVTKALTAAGAKTPELLFESVKDNLQFSVDEKLSNLAALTEHLTKKFPEQFGIEKPSESIDGGSGTGRSVHHLTKDTLSKMNSAQIMALDWQEVRRALSDA